MVVCDNFYTSVQLFSALRSKQTYGLGVLRESRAPGGVKFNEKDHERGHSRTTYSRTANMAVTAWKGSRVVFFLTTIGNEKTTWTEYCGGTSCCAGASSSTVRASWRSRTCS